MPIAMPHPSNTVEIMEEQLATENIVSLSSAEERERKIFMGDVNKFMAEIGKPLSKIPIMGYKELDLFQLFKEVIAHGGFIEVVKNVGTWSKIWKRLGNFDPSITDSSFRLKKNYERYLLEYEYKCYPEHRLQAIELGKHLQLKKSQTIETTRPVESELLNITASLNGGKKSPREKNVSKRKTSRGGRRSSLKDLTREINGEIKMPLVLGDLTIESLGTVNTSSPYTTDKHIYPIGFSSSRMFNSMVSPANRTKYTCIVKDDGTAPQFVVMAEDDPSNPIVAHSPSACWRIILKRVSSLENSLDKTPYSVSGSMRFGFEHSVVSALLKEAANNADCKMELGNSPIQSKRSYSSGTSSSSSSDASSDEELSSVKRRKTRDYEIASFSMVDVSYSTRDEIEDIETAVATLQALKYSVF